MNKKQTKEFITELYRYLQTNAWQESPFSSPEPSVNVELFRLIDKIGELRGMTKEDNIQEYNDIHDKYINTAKSN